MIGLTELIRTVLISVSPLFVGYCIADCGDGYSLLSTGVQYHRKLENSWETQTALNVVCVKTDEYLYRHTEVRLAIVRFPFGFKNGLYLGIAGGLQFVLYDYLQDTYSGARTLDPAIYFTVGFKHVFRNGLCLNVAAGVGAKPWHSYDLSSSYDRVRSEGWGETDFDSVGIGYAF